ncbi:hypothetical protein GCM10022224_083880 [Nonomuraea antimicrobica]|uniref:Uncharacterized protein n=1 Tax=Nonomuraea antimicrobica TaxID=561173 RepID=A0ABP7DKE6_9ACTN
MNESSSDEREEEVTGGWQVTGGWEVAGCAEAGWAEAGWAGSASLDVSSANDGRRTFARDPPSEGRSSGVDNAFCGGGGGGESSPLAERGVGAEWSSPLDDDRSDGGVGLSPLADGTLGAVGTGSSRFAEDADGGV